MKRALLGLILAIGLASVVQAQTCSVNVSNYAESDVFTGTSVANGIVASGSGSGPETVGNSFAKVYDANSYTGDITEILELTSLTVNNTQNSAPETGAWFSGLNRVWLHVKDSNPGGTHNYTVYFDKSLFGNWTSIGSHSLSALPVWLELTRSVSSGNVTGSYSTDGVNYSSLGTISNFSKGSLQSGILVDAGDNTDLTTATFQSVSINGAFPALSYVSIGGGPSGRLQQGIVVQGGTLFIAAPPRNQISFTAAPQSGCGPTVTPFNTAQVKNANGITLLSSNSQQIAAQQSCSPSCGFTGENPPAGQGDGSGFGPITLTHGQTYTFLSQTVVQVEFGAPAIVNTTITLNP